MSEFEIQENEKATVAPSRFSRVMRMGAYATAFLGLTAGSLCFENREAIHAAWNMRYYHEPSEDDIIPDRTGCELPPQALMEDYMAAVSEEQDNALSDLQGLKSTATKKSLPSQSERAETFVSQEQLFGLRHRYFDTKIGEYTSAQTGITFEDMRHIDDPGYRINWHEVERFITDVFRLQDLYAHPGVAAIVRCFNDRYKNEQIHSLPVEVGVVADDRACLGGNSVVRLAKDQTAKDCHSQGLGSPEVELSLFGTIQISNKRYLIVPGAVNNVANLDSMLQKRFIHELIHILFFEDLSDFTAEADEQERFVKYVTNVLMEYYEQHNTTPRIVIIEP